VLCCAGEAVLLLGELRSGCWLAGRFRWGTSVRLGGVVRARATVFIISRQLRSQQCCNDTFYTGSTLQLAVAWYPDSCQQPEHH
jgi:hypothetical protein